MARETEIKLRIDDLQSFRRALRQLGARHVNGKNARVHEWNVVFDTPGSELKRRGQLIRIRTEKPAPHRNTPAKSKWKHTTLTLKRPVTRHRTRNGAHKIRDEIELQVTDGEALTRILEAMGMRAWFRYEKYRTTFHLPRSQRWAGGLLIELDETPIGTFVELEGPATAIDRAARALGYARHDYITKNYFVLYREECRRNREKVCEMVFAKRRNVRAPRSKR